MDAVQTRKNEEYAAELLRALDRSGKSLRQACREAGLTAGGMSGYFKGKHGASLDRLLAFADSVGYDLHSVIATKQEIENAKQADIPVFNLSALPEYDAGEWTRMLENVEPETAEKLRAFTTVAAPLGLRVTEDLPQESLAVGDVVIVDPSAQAQEGRLAAFWHEGRGYLGRLRRDGRTLVPIIEGVPARNATLVGPVKSSVRSY